jgi:F-type H+-transporting ATPase subunit alpha
MDKVPVNKVKQFEKEFLDLMRVSHKGVLDNLRAGKFEDADVDTMKKVAIDLASRYN